MTAQRQASPRNRQRPAHDDPPLAILAVPDLQYPFHHLGAINTMCQYVRQRHVDHVVVIGDALDFDCLASQNKTSLRAVEGKRIRADFDGCHEVLAEIMDAARCRNPVASGVLIEGNHEYRFTRFVDEHPVIEGLTDVPTGLRLKELGMGWVPQWSKGAIHEVGPVTFIHGDSHAANHAKVNLRTWNRTVFYGHTHDDDMATGRDRAGNRIVAQSIGHMCDASQMNWVRGRPVNWTMMFAEIMIPRWALTGAKGQGPEFAYVLHRMADDGSFLDPNGRLWTPNVA